jgi:Tol biopolymer transport system component
VPGIRTPRELYLRDTAGPATTWVSGDARNIAFSVLGTSNIFSFNHALSADGKLVAFECTTNPLSASYPRGLILRYSVDTGLTDLVHTNAYASVTMPFEDARTLEMSPDGRFIVFVGNTNGISGSTTCIYRWDALSGATVLVSGDLAGNVQTGSTCQWPSMDSSGRYVSFLSTADNLVTNSVPGEYHVYIRDIDAGITTLLDAGTNTSLFGPAIVPKISSDGRFVAFESPDSSLVPNDHNHDYDIFLRDLLSNTVEVVSAHDPALASTSGAGPSSLSSLSLSGDGRLLAFSSDADDLVVADANGFRDIFVRDLRFGTNDLVSISTNGLVSDGQSTEPSISGNGRYVAFTSTADNLADGDTNHARDVFVRDLETGTTTLVSLNLAGTGPGNRESYSPSITADGRYVLFRSLATDLAPHTFGGSQNLFLRDLQLGTNYALTLGGVLTSSLSPNGRFVSFANSAICLWDIASATLVYSNVIHNSGAVIGVSPDGQRIVYFDAGSLKAVDLVSSSNWTINSSVYNLQHLGLRFTADGRFLAYHAAPSAPPLQIFLYDFEAGTNILISEAFDGSGVGNSDSDSPWITPDGRFVAYRSVASNLVAGAASNGQPNIFLYDRLLATTTLLSASRYTSNTADARSFFPVLSDDGRTLAFESWASDLVANDFNHGGDVFVYNFLIASVSAGSGGAGPTLTWPARPGETYSVEFKNSLDDAIWQPVTGTVTITGTQAQLTDLAPSLTQRFYRIVAH